MCKVAAKDIQVNNKIIAVKKMIAYTTSIILLLMLFASAYYIAVETGHHCTGEDCPICQEISACVHTLNSFANLVVFLTSSLLILLASLFLMAYSNRNNVVSTLVSLKVKLTN